MTNKVITLAKAHKISLSLFKWINDQENGLRYSRNLNINFSSYPENGKSEEIENTLTTVIAEAQNDYNNMVADIQQAIEIAYTLRNSIGELNSSPIENGDTVNLILNTNAKLKAQLKVINSATIVNVATAKVKNTEDSESVFSRLLAGLKRYWQSNDSYVSDTFSVPLVTRENLASSQETAIMINRELLSNEEKLIWLNNHFTIELPMDVWQWLESKLIV